MSLIIVRENTLHDVAVVTIKAKSGEKVIETKGDLTLIKIDNEVVGLNVSNFKKYFNAHEGAHTINAEQVEAIAKLGYKIENPESYFSIGEVIERNVHPKSEKLFLLKVRVEKDLQIVTNSLNSLVGTKVVVARIGAVLPSGLSIVHSKVMGIESEGMLCGGETLDKEKTEGVLLVEGNPGDKYIL